MNLFKNGGTTGLRRTANEIKRYRSLHKLLVALAGLMSVSVTIVYIVTVLYSKYGSFTVRISKLDSLDYSLSLSETRDFYTQTSRLNMNASEDITNISKDSLPVDLDTDQGGPKFKTGDNFVAYTYFLRNSGSATIDAEYRLYIANMTMDIEQAVRVRLYVNGVSNDYAWTRSDGQGAEDGTIEFLSDEDITVGYINAMAPYEVTRFTVVIWLEGDDPDCLDNIIGGTFKIDMNIKVISVTDHPEIVVGE